MMVMAQIEQFLLLIDSLILLVVSVSKVTGRLLLIPSMYVAIYVLALSIYLYVYVYVQGVRNSLVRVVME